MSVDHCARLSQTLSYLLPLNEVGNTQALLKGKNSMASLNYTEQGLDSNSPGFDPKPLSFVTLPGGSVEPSSQLVGLVPSRLTGPGEARRLGSLQGWGDHCGSLSLQSNRAKPQEQNQRLFPGVETSGCLPSQASSSVSRHRLRRHHCPHGEQLLSRGSRE